MKCGQRSTREYKTNTNNKMTNQTVLSNTKVHNILNLKTHRITNINNNIISIIPTIHLQIKTQIRTMTLLIKITPKIHINIKIIQTHLQTLHNLKMTLINPNPIQNLNFILSNKTPIKKRKINKALITSNKESKNYKKISNKDLTNINKNQSPKTKSIPKKYPPQTNKILEKSSLSKNNHQFLPRKKITNKKIKPLLSLKLKSISKPNKHHKIITIFNANKIKWTWKNNLNNKRSLTKRNTSNKTVRNFQICQKRVNQLLLIRQ